MANKAITKEKLNNRVTRAKFKDIINQTSSISPFDININKQIKIIIREDEITLSIVIETPNRN